MKGVKLRGTRVTRHVDRIRKGIYVNNFSGKTSWRRPLQDREEYVWIALKLILGKLVLQA